MNIPIIELEHTYCPEKVSEILLSFIERAYLVYWVDEVHDTCTIVKNRYGGVGVFSLRMLQEFKKCAIE
jgi:hypothetical protein